MSTDAGGTPLVAAQRRGAIASDEQALGLARLTVDTLSDRQASDIVLLDVRQVTTIADYFVLATGETERQLRALQEASDRLFTEHRIELLRQEGTADSGWILLDFGAVIVHLFAAPQRAYYQLERVWEQAVPVVRIQ